MGNYARTASANVGYQSLMSSNQGGPQRIAESRVSVTPSAQSRGVNVQYVTMPSTSGSLATAGGVLSLQKEIQRKAYQSYRKIIKMNPEKFDGGILAAFFYLQDT